ncbi:MAG: hypothetical protein JKP98_04550 [Rhodobacteraceae bacterium]|nr:hypothetical protein [Paracoccaceae bacterium]MBL4556715.1 hypothetical protein [Paracoccaceae bacterium]
MKTAVVPEKGLEEFLEEGFEIKGITIDAGRYVVALQRGRRAAIVHVEGVDGDYPETKRVMEIGYP